MTTLLPCRRAWPDLPIPSWNRCGALSAFALPLLLFAGFAAAAPARAATDLARYAVEVFPAAPHDVRLPAELRDEAPAAPEFRPADLLSATERDLEIRWATRESPGLSGYRVTATIEGGALSGMTARWTVAAGGGEAGGGAGLRVYRLHLPVAAAGPLRLRTALEALGDDGSRLLVAVRDTVSLPAAIPGVRESRPPALLSRPGEPALALNAPAAAPAAPAAARFDLPATRVAIPLPPPGLRTAERSGLRSRAPPAQPFPAAVERS